MIAQFGPWATTFDTAGLSLARFWKSRIAGLPLARSAGQSPTRRGAAVLAVCAALTLAAPTLTLSPAPAQPPEPDREPAAARAVESEPLSEIKLDPLPAALVPSATGPGAPAAKLDPIGLAEVTAAPLVAQGTLALSPDSIIHVHSPTSGEIVAIGPADEDGERVENVAARELRVGSRVSKGQLLAVVASKEVGELKSELVGALAQQRLDELQMERLRSLAEMGVVAKRKIVEAEQTVESDKAAVEKAKDRLRAYHIPEDQLERVEHDAAESQAENDVDVRYARKAAEVAEFTYKKNQEAVAKVKNAVAATELKKLELEADKARLAYEAAVKKAAKAALSGDHWSRFEIRAARAGIILERNAVAGAAIDADVNLLTIADLSQLLVSANVDEKLAARLEALSTDQRNWSIFAEPRGQVGTGSIESIGKIVEPARQTVALMGSLDNRSDAFRPGLEVMVVVPHLPVEGPLRAIPQAALLPGDASRKEWKVWVAPKGGDAPAEVQVVVRLARSGPWAICQPASDKTPADPLPVGSKVIVWREREQAGVESPAKALVALTDENSTPLADAIKTFNQRAALDRIGREQPPLTEDEVVAAILWSDVLKSEPVTAAEYAAFRQIAETRRMPKGSEFEVLTGFVPNDQMAFERWSVRIRMPRLGQAHQGWTYAFPIRERNIASRPIGEEERKVMAQWSRDGMPSMGRAEHIKKRAEAQAIDKANREAAASQSQPD